LPKILRTIATYLVYDNVTPCFGHDPVLLEWLGQDILSVAEPAYAQRCLLNDFVTAELLARVALCPHRLEPVPRTLKNGRQEFWLLRSSSMRT